MAAPSSWNLNGFYFDAWLRLSHNTSLTITQHPVETGAAVSDHSYVNQRRFSFDIGFTDTVRSPIQGNSLSRSINAYNYLVSLQSTRDPLILTSKYGTNSNVLIESIDASDDFRTGSSLRATITLVELIQADTKFIRVSTDSQTTDQTVKGQVSPRQLSPAIIQAAAKNGIDLSDQ